MKKVLIPIVAVLLGIGSYAKKPIKLTELGTIKGPHPSIVPTVTSDDDDIDLKCDSVLYNVDIVIRDQYGAVMHQSTQTLGPNETSLYVPDVEGDSEKTTIDLYYDNKHLSGYFEE